MVRTGGNARRFTSDRVRSHLRVQLGEPFSTLVEEVAEGVEVAVHGFADVPFDDQVTLVTEGIGEYFRGQGFNGSSGYAQELVFVVDKKYFGQAVLDFFIAAVSVYVDQGALLSWDEPIRLSATVPGEAQFRYLLPTPSAVFDEEFQHVDDHGGPTNFCMLVPVYESEANFVLKNGPTRLYERFEEDDVDVSDLGREMLGLSSRR